MWRGSFASSPRAVQLGDGHVEAGVRDVSLGPEPGQDPGPGQGPGALPEEELEQVERTRLEVDLALGAQELARL
jgi:hypothetical protein